MEIQFVAPELPALDALKCEAFAVSFFEDERPLAGALGLVDWRLCGAVSRLIQDGKVAGGAAEATLVPARPKLSFEKLFLFGLGPVGSFGEEMLVDATERMLSALDRARVRASVLALPGRALGLITPDAAMKVFLPLAARHTEHDEVTIVEPVEAQRLMRPMVERDRRRSRVDQAY